MKFAEILFLWLKRLAALGVIAGCAYGVNWFLQQDVSSQFTTPPEPALAMTNVEVRVRNDGRVRWILKVRDIEIAPDEVNYIFSGVDKGRLFRDKKPPFSFRADSGSYNTITKELHVKGPVVLASSNGDYLQTGDLLWFGTQENLMSPQPVRLSLDGNMFRADSLEAQGSAQDTVLLRGNARLYLPDVEKDADEKTRTDIKDTKLKKNILRRFRIAADNIEYHRPQKILRCFANRTAPADANAPAKPQSMVIASSAGFSIRSADIVVDDSAKFVHALGSVHIIKKREKPSPKRNAAVQAMQKRDTTIDTEEVFYYWKEGRAVFPYAMSAKQENLDVSAMTASLDNKLGKLDLNGAVLLKLEGGQWIVREKIVGADSGDKVKQSIKEDTMLKCLSLNVDFNTENLVAFGDVLLKQKDQFMQADKANYDSAKKTWTLTGAPIGQDKNGRILAKDITYDAKNRTFDAKGNAYTEFLPEKDNRADLRDAFKQRDGDNVKDTFDKDRVSVRADNLHNDDKQNVLVADGAARITYRDVVLTGEKIFVKSKTKEAWGRGGLVMTDSNTKITADRIHIDWGTHVTEAQGGVRIDYRGRPATDKQSARDPFTMTCESLKYNSKTKRGETDTHPEIISLGRRIKAPSMRFDMDKNTFDFSGGVVMHQDNGDWMRDKDYIDADDDKTRRIAEKPTDITAMTAHFDSDENHFLLDSKVVVTQKDKRMEADSIEFFGKEKRFVAEGTFKLTQDKGDWLFDDNIIDPDTNEDVKERARGPVVILANRFESRYGERRIFIDGNVRIDQDKSKGRADRLWYYGKEKKVILEGNVSAVDEKGREVRAERMIYDDEAHTIEAFHSVRGKGRVEKE